MPTHLWPLFDLRVRTPRLEIRLPTDDEQVALARLGAEGIHDPGSMPFVIPWTDTPSPRRERESLQWWWRQRADWSAARWHFTGAAFVGGEPAGVQDLMAEHFAELGSVRTSSWLVRRLQGRGLGKEMRAAVLHLAFAGLGARAAHSEAFHDNRASLETSRSLGYEPNGEETVLRRGAPDRLVRLRLSRAAWERGRRHDIEIEGLAPCRSMFGLPPDEAS